MTMPRGAPMHSNIAAIVITFHPDAGFFDRMQVLVNQVRLIIIVDNASSNETFATIERVKNEFANVCIIRNDENVGIARALNIGVKRAREAGCTWVLTMDHDSLAEPNMVQELINTYESTRALGMTLDLIGANFTYETTGKVAFAKECHGGKSFVRKVGIQTSGALLSLYAYEKVGPFREDFFIDYVDTEYCLRLKHHGFKGAIACRARMLHCIGNIQKHPIFGSAFTTANYSALRRYYRTRNGVQLLREYMFREPLWVFRKFCRTLYELTLVFIREKDKLHKFIRLFQGIADNARAKSGKAFL